MYLQDLNANIIDAEALKMELLNELESGDAVSEEEAKEAAAQLYQEAFEATLADFYKLPEGFMPTVALEFDRERGVRNIWEKIRKYICGFLKEDSTAADIIDKILEALASIIPGGIIIKWLVQKIVRYFLSLSYAALCRVTAFAG